MMALSRIETLIRQLQGAAPRLRGRAVAVGTGVAFADIAVTHDFGVIAIGLAMQHVGGTFGADAVVCLIQAESTTQTTFRALTRLGGNIPVGQTVFLDYVLWPA